MGIYLDHRLKGTYHLNERIKKARGLFFKIKNAIGTYWGPSPWALRWAINGIILPMLSYGSMIWSRACETKTAQKQLRRLHRLMISALMPIRRSTPTQGLEIILNMPPLHLKIKELALKGLLRVIPKSMSNAWTNKSKKGKLGHLAWGRKELSEMGISHYDYDSMKGTNINQMFLVDHDSFKSGLPNSTCDLKCYTDGSKFSGHTGFGFAITSDSMELQSGNGYLGTHSTVFQAEVTAIQKCAEALAKEHVSEAIIYCDSQAALAALSSLNIKHKTVQNCISALNEASKCKKITLAWVKAHANHPGNELADQLAKAGTTNTNNTLDIPYPLKWATTKINEHTHKTWNQEWWLYPEARQTKYWFQSVNKKKSEELLKLSRVDLGLMVQLLTGHNRLKYHQFVVDPSSDPTCRKCREGTESTWHILGDCPRLMDWRLQSFNRHFLEKYPVWNLTQFLRFVRLVKLKEMNDGEGHSLTHA